MEAAIELHQAGRIPPNSYVLDVDTVGANARHFAAEAARHELLVLAMTKQVGRNPLFLRACSDAEIDSFVAVDLEDAHRIHDAGHRIGHVGHLVQVPRAEATSAASMRPEFWTVFSEDKAVEAANAAREAGRTQDLLARVVGEGDAFYRGHEGGFPAEQILRVAEVLDGLAQARFAGVTTFPALLFDNQTGQVLPTPNMKTIQRAAERLTQEGRPGVEVNAPGTTSSTVLAMLASAGATQVEPGHGLTGTTPLHAMQDLPEIPALLYLSEISHFHGGRAYCFGGGLYIDPVFPPYSVKALSGKDPEAALADRVPAEIPRPEAIDYYGMLDVPDGKAAATGDTVVFGFRIQAFVTRAFLVPVSGISRGSPKVEGIWHANGIQAT